VGGADYLLVVVAVSSVSTASVLVRLSGVHGFAAATLRLALGSAITMLFVAATGEYRKLAKLDKRTLALMMVSGIALALHFDLWMASLWYTSIAVSVTIVDSYPVLMAVVGSLLFNERYTRKQLVGTGIAVAGVAGLSWASSKHLSGAHNDSLVGAALAFCGMLAVVAYFSIGKHVRMKVSTLLYTVLVYGMGAIASLVASTAIHVRLAGYDTGTYVFLALLAIVPMIGGHTVLNFLLGRMELLVVTAPVLGEPVGATLLGAVILGEIPSVPVAIFMTITLVGIALVLLGGTTKSRSSTC